MLPKEIRSNRKMWMKQNYSLREKGQSLSEKERFGHCCVSRFYLLMIPFCIIMCGLQRDPPSISAQRDSTP